MPLESSDSESSDTDSREYAVLRNMQIDIEAAEFEPRDEHNYFVEHQIDAENSTENVNVVSSSTNGVVSSCQKKEKRKKHREGTRRFTGWTQFNRLMKVRYNCSRIAFCFT